MPVTFTDVGGANPSTIDFKFGTVSLTRNSTVHVQEIICLGSPQTTNALMEVVAAPPASTEWGAVVRIASGPSSAVDLQMRPVFSSTSADNPVTATLNLGTLQSTVAPGSGSSGLIVRIASGPSSAVDLQMRPVMSSTNADNPVRVFGPGSTTWASSAGFHFDSSGALQIVGTFTADTTITVAALPANSSKVELTTIAAGYLSSAAATNNTPSFNVRINGGPQASTDLIMRPVFSSTNTDNPVFAALNLGGLQSTVAPPSGSSGLIVRIASGPSSAADLQMRPVFSSTNTDNPVRAVLSSSSADNPVRCFGPASTTWASSAGFHFDSSGALNVTIVNGSATDNDTGALAGGKTSLAITMAQTFGWDGTTNWMKVQASSASPSSNAVALNVRPVLNAVTNYCNSTVGSASTATTIVSSAATTCPYVYALSLMSTELTSINVAFMDGATQKWVGKVQAPSSGISGFNLAVSPPAYLFKGSTGAPLTFNISGSTIVGMSLSVAYWVST